MIEDLPVSRDDLNSWEAKLKVTATWREHYSMQTHYTKIILRLIGALRAAWDNVDSKSKP